MELASELQVTIQLEVATHSHWHWQVGESVQLQLEVASECSHWQVPPQSPSRTGSTCKL